jgi:O-antigen/teichoic acid export membrane protein
MDKYVRKTLLDSSIIFVFAVLSALCAYLFRMILAKNLSLADFGLFFSLVAFTSMLFVFKDFGMTHAIVYFIPRFVASKNFRNVKSITTKVFRINFISSLIVAVLMVVFSKFIMKYYFHQENNIILILFALVFFLDCIGLLFQNLFHAFQDQFYYALHNFVKNVLVVLFVILGLKYISNYGIIIPILCYGASYLLVSIIFGLKFYLSTFKQYAKLDKYGDFSTMKLLTFGVPATLSTLGYLIINSADVLILTYFRTLEEVGLYNAALPIILLLTYLPIAVSLAIRPMSAELWTKKAFNSLNLVIENTTRFALILLLPISLILVIYPDIVLRILFGETLVQASTALSILAIGAVFYGLTHIQINFLFGISGPKVVTKIWAIGAIVNIVLNLILVPKYGIIGAAIGTTISYLVLLIYSSILLQQKVQSDFNIREYLYILLSGAIFLLVINYLKKWININWQVEMLLVIGVASLIYVSILFLLKVISISDFKKIITTISSRNKK